MQWRLSHLIADARPNKFVTLTCNPARHPTPYHAFRSMSAALPRLVKQLRRLHDGEEVEYLAVWELTRRGWPHLHIVARMPYTPQRWLSARWRLLTGAGVVDIRTVSTGDAAAMEIAKYLVKDLEAPEGTRRWRASSSFLPEPMRPRPDPDAEQTEWTLEEISTSELAIRWRLDALTTIRLDDGSILAFDVWDAADESLDLVEQLLIARPPPSDPANRSALGLLLDALRRRHAPPTLPTDPRARASEPAPPTARQTPLLWLPDAP